MNHSGILLKDKNQAFLEAVWRHPWATIGTLQIEAALTDYGVRQARRAAMEAKNIEVFRIANKGQPHPPRRYGLTPGGAYAARLPITNAPERAKDLLAAPHLDHVRRRFLADPALRARTVWAISPWRAGGGLKLDALLCVRNDRGEAVLVAFVVPPDGAVSVWYMLELVRRWTRPDIALAIISDSELHPGLPYLSGSRSRRLYVVYLHLGIGGGRTMASPSVWLRITPGAFRPRCPWDDPALGPAGLGPGAFLKGRVPPDPPTGATMMHWLEASDSSLSRLANDVLDLSHGEVSLLGGLLRYPAFTPEELTPLIVLSVRSARAGLRRLAARGWVERLPLFVGDRYVLTEQGLTYLAYRTLETPARFRASRAWATDPWPFTGSPPHMALILDFMRALIEKGRLASWDLVQARYAYTIALTTGDLTRPRTIYLVPDSRGVLEIENREVPFWLEIDRGTRTGADLTRQLEKYVLARFTVAGSAPIPMLLYVVAKESGSEETRLRDVARRLVGLVRQYNLPRPPAILLSTWGLLTDDYWETVPDPLKPVWCAPWRLGRFVSPVEILRMERFTERGQEAA